MRTKPTLMFAASAFVVTAVLFASAMVLANSLSIPDPARRFLPRSARELPSEQASDDMELASDDHVGLVWLPDGPVPEVTAVPEPPSAAEVEATHDTGGSNVSGDAVTDAGDGSVPFKLNDEGNTPVAASRYSGPAWPAWRGPTAPTAPARREPVTSEPEPAEPEPSEPEPSPTPSVNPPASEPAASESTETSPPASEPESSDSVSPDAQAAPTQAPAARPGTTR